MWIDLELINYQKYDNISILGYIGFSWEIYFK